MPRKKKTEPSGLLLREKNRLLRKQRSCCCLCRDLLFDWICTNPQHLMVINSKAGAAPLLHQPSGSSAPAPFSAPQLAPPLALHGWKRLAAQRRSVGTEFHRPAVRGCVRAAGGAAGARTKRLCAAGEPGSAAGWAGANRAVRGSSRGPAVAVLSPSAAHTRTRLRFNTRQGSRTRAKRPGFLCKPLTTRGLRPPLRRCRPGGPGLRRKLRTARGLSIAAGSRIRGPPPSAALGDSAARPAREPPPPVPRRGREKQGRSALGTGPSLPGQRGGPAGPDPPSLQLYGRRRPASPRR